MSKFSSIIFLLFLTSYIYTQDSQTVLNCKCLEKINKDYGPDSLVVGKEKWFKFESSDLLRNKIFVNINSENPVIKSISPPSKYLPEGEIHEFNGSIIHRTGDILMLKWENTFGNKIWIATINLRYKKAIVTESYDGLTSFGMNIEILDCN